MLNNRVANGRGMLCDNVVCAWGGGGGGGGGGGAAEAQYDVRGWEQRRPAESQTQKREERIAEVHVYCANSNTGRLPLIRIRYNSNFPCNSNYFCRTIFCKSLQVKIECIIRSTKSAPVG